MLPALAKGWVAGYARGKLPLNNAPPESLARWQRFKKRVDYIAIIVLRRPFVFIKHGLILMSGKETEHIHLCGSVDIFKPCSVFSVYSSALTSTKRDVAAKYSLYATIIRVAGYLISRSETAVKGWEDVEVMRDISLYAESESLVSPCRTCARS